MFPGSLGIAEGITFQHCHLYQWFLRNSEDAEMLSKSVCGLSVSVGGCFHGVLLM